LSRFTTAGLLLVLTSLSIAQGVPNQAAPAPPAPSSVKTDADSALERKFAIHFIEDQRAIWMSPLKLRRKDIRWVVPAGIVLGGLIYRDVDAYRGMSVNDSHASTAKTFTDAGVVGLGGMTAGIYFLGVLRKDDHYRETGVLATEALADSMAVDYALKYALGRQRPTEGSGQGQFFQLGSESFPSGHAIAAWSIASVIAHEYPGALTKLGVYGLASAISLLRVPAQQHFPSDVVVGSALGYFIGEHVYKTRHDPYLGGEQFGSFHGESKEDPGGSVYVPLDSWVYPALDRLAALGLIHSQFRGQRPWTRSECLRQVDEAQGGDLDASPQGSQLVEELKAELQPRQRPINIDSVYFRATGISGPPLTDAYHFGQTITNDYGRPYEDGFNSVAGASASATYGRWAFYLQAEYQHSPSAQAPSTTTLAAEAAADFTPTPIPTAQNSINRARLLDSYFSYTVREWQFSVGKQSLWWGPGQDGAMNFSDNAEPVPMFRISRVTPLQLPSILGWLGPVRGEAFWGQLAGHRFVRTDAGLFGPSLENQPMIQGVKFSFKPTSNLEFGFSETTIWGGPGQPLNFHAFLNSYSLGNTIPGQNGDPGDRRAGFDFSYQVPKLRHRMVLYSDAFTEDEFSPIAYPRKSSFRSGVYFPTLPWASRLDFRAEGVYTDIPNLDGNGIAYANNRFLNGFTNKGQLMGDWIGREGSGFTASSTYWHSAKKTATLSYRNVNVNPNFIGGGIYSDFAGRLNWQVAKRATITMSSQYEHWSFPLLAARPQDDVAVSAGITLWTSK